MSEFFICIALAMGVLNTVFLVLQLRTRKNLIRLLHEIARKVIQIRAFNLQFDRIVRELIADLQAQEKEMVHNRVTLFHRDRVIGRIRAELARQQCEVEQIKQSLDVLRN